MTVEDGGVDCPRTVWRETIKELSPFAGGACGVCGDLDFIRLVLDRRAFALILLSRTQAEM